MRIIEAARSGGSGDLPEPTTLLESLPFIQQDARNYLAKNKNLPPLIVCKRDDGEVWKGSTELGDVGAVDRMFDSIYDGFEKKSIVEYVVVADGRDLVLTDTPYIIVFYGSMERNLRIGCSYEFKGDLLFYSDWMEL